MSGSRFVGKLVWGLIASSSYVACRAPEPWQPSMLGTRPFEQTVCVNSHMPLGHDVTATTRRSDEIVLLKQLGVHCVRLDFFWWQIEPQPGVLDFAGHERTIDALAAAGINVLALLTSAPDWAVTSQNDSTIVPSVFAKFAAAVASHFAGRVSHYEIWNEPNWYFWRPEPDPIAYGALLKAAATAIRAADANAKIVLGGNFSLEGMFAGRLWQFLYDVAAAHPDLGQHFDILSYHPYTSFQIEPPELGDSDTKASLHLMTQAIRLFGDSISASSGGWPLWNTETGWSTLNVGERNQALYLARALLISAALDVERFVVYNAIDEDPESNVPLPAEWHYGLIFYDVNVADGHGPSVKPAYSAIKNLLNLAQGLFVVHDDGWTNVANGAKPYLVTLANDTRMVQLLWSPTPNESLFVNAPTLLGWRLVNRRWLLTEQAPQATAQGYALGDEPLVFEFARQTD